MKVAVLMTSRSMENAANTLLSIKRQQDVTPQIFIYLGQKRWWESVDGYIARQLNEMLDQVNFAEYPYILKSDDDCFYPVNFLKETIHTMQVYGYDIVGTGAAFIMRTRAFATIMKGKFFVCPIMDSYTFYKFTLKNPKRVLFMKQLVPMILKKQAQYNWIRWLRIGIACKRVGLPPRYKRSKWWYLGYLIGHLLPRYPIAKEWSKYLKEHKPE